MQGGEANQHFTPPIVQHIETMNGEGAPEYVVDPSMYFSAAANYGYYCTGFESSSEWDDHHRIFGLDGTDVQYAGAQTDNLPYVYYAPTYGYGESQFNPYNPYIPGAMIGADGSYMGTQYYTISPYQNTASSSGYFPVAVQTKPDTVASSSADPLFNTTPPVTSRVSSSETRHSQSSSSTGYAKNPSKVGSSHSHSFGKTSEGSRANSVASQRYSVHRNGSVGNQSSSSFVRQSQHGNSITSQGREVSHNQMKIPLMSGSFPGSVSNAEGQGVGDGAWSKFYQRSSVDDTSRAPDSLVEQNRGPRTNKSKNQFVVKAYTKKAGACDPQGNIVISADEYNKDDFQLDHVYAKFFVIKSYSEDDVHKSIKYNIWSSTPNGNRKLNTAYEDAQLLAAGQPRGCPIFLYFSVNASGQFCGVAEMVGPVDFQNDMDFWQQDKWSGSFPVKWHMIKDVPNTNFRHIILENNEHKPVTNSRDTQEIMYKPGMEMLKIFKNFTPKTSLLDDFLYYENRQKIMLEERARLFHKPIAPSFQPMVEISGPNLGTKGIEHTSAPAFVGPDKMESTVGQTSLGIKISISGSDSQSAKTQNEFKESEPIGSGKTTEDKTGQVSSITKADNSSAENGSAKKQNVFQVNTSNTVSTLKIGSLTINPKQTDHKPLGVAASRPPAAAKVTTGLSDVVTVGSVPVKVNGHNIKRTSGILTVGTIPLDPKSLRLEKGDAAGKGQSLPKKSNA